jgi:ribosomal protein S18 acetylase RimI-like enzyme
MIRRATSEDADAVADVYIASFRGLAFLPRVHSDEEIRAWIRSQLLPKCEVWIAYENGRVVGMAALSEALLEQLYVHPDAQSRGVGAALLEHAKARRPRGFALWVFQENVRARRFYERHGCRLVRLTDGTGNEERTPDALYEWRPAAGEETRPNRTRPKEARPETSPGEG